MLEARQMSTASRVLDAEEGERLWRLWSHHIRAHQTRRLLRSRRGPTLDYDAPRHEATILDLEWCVVDDVRMTWFVVSDNDRKLRDRIKVQWASGQMSLDIVDKEYVLNGTDEALVEARLREWL